MVFRGRVIGLERRFRLKSQFHFDALDQFLDLTIFAVLGALLLVVGWFVIPTVCHRPGLPDHLLGQYTGAEQFARNLLCDVGTPVTSLEASTTNNCGRLTTCPMEEANVVEEAITPTIRSMSVIAILGHLSARTFAMGLILCSQCLSA